MEDPLAQPATLQMSKLSPGAGRECVQALSQAQSPDALLESGDTTLHNFHCPREWGPAAVHPRALPLSLCAESCDTKGVAGPLTLSLVSQWSSSL